MMLAVLACATGCRDRKQGLTLNFVFQDAKGISVGKKVMGDGVFVGQVIAPPQSPKPKQVIVSVRINGLAPEKMAYMTKDLSAVIKKDSLVAGDVYMDLIFPKEPGEPVADGAILQGHGGPGDLLDLASITLPRDPQQFLAMLKTAFVAVDRTAAGETTFYLNWASLLAALLVVVALVLDLLIRLPQGADRERSSPRILREVWTLFCLMLVVRLFVAIVRSLGGLKILSEDLLRTVRVGAASIGDVLAQEWPFWVLAIVLITIRFKFDLLMRAKRD
jgi:hypothetical protein